MSINNIIYNYISVLTKKEQQGIKGHLMLSYKYIAGFIMTLFNKSLEKGYFLWSFKTAEITPVLKKPSLDSSSPVNYSPISNLQYHLFRNSWRGLLMCNCCVIFSWVDRYLSTNRLTENLAQRKVLCWKVESHIRCTKGCWWGERHPTGSQRSIWLCGSSNLLEATDSVIWNSGCGCLLDCFVPYGEMSQSVIQW